MNDKTTFLSQRILEMQEPATLQMAQAARDLKAKGVDVISLSLGEPDFDTPAPIKEAAKKALDEGFTKYTPVPGLPELRKAIHEKFKRDNKLDYGVNGIVVANGAKQGIANLCLSMLNPGDEVIIFAPYWVSYDGIVRLAGGVPVFIQAGIEQDYKVTAQQVEAAITDKTRLLIFSSPCNPTGSVFSYEELKAIADVIGRHENIFIASDEIYEYINFTSDFVSIGSFEQVKDRTITINGFSKGYAMTGWRLGYLGGPEWVAQACIKMQGQFTSGANSFGQKAATFALNSGKELIGDMQQAFLKRRDLIIKLLNQVPGFKINKPDGAFFIFPDISAYFGKSYEGTTIKGSNDFCDFLLNVAHVSTVPGIAFGADECIRISYSVSEKLLHNAVERIGAAVEKLK